MSNELQHTNCTDTNSQKHTQPQNKHMTKWLPLYIVYLVLDMICQVKTTAFDTSCQMAPPGSSFDMLCQIGPGRGPYLTRMHGNLISLSINYLMFYMICQGRTAAFDIACQMACVGWSFDMLCQIGLDRGSCSTLQAEPTCTLTRAFKQNHLTQHVK